MSGVGSHGKATMFHLAIISAALLVSINGASIKDEFQLDGRIVGGHAIAITAAPYQAAYELNGQQKCGASVISATFALTAAHCSRSDSASNVAIRVGSGVRGSGGTVHKASQIINHERYHTSPATDFDVALIKVATAFTFSASVRAIPLATSAPAAGSAVDTSGWGTTSEGGSPSSQLQQVQVNIISTAQCNSAYQNRITSTMLCAGVTAGGKDTCQGDSGGPLVHSGQLVGVVSWGVGCARAQYPGVYANVAALHAWVKQHAGV